MTSYANVPGKIKKIHKTLKFKPRTAEKEKKLFV